jgi:hypothetical protein
MESDSADHGDIDRREIRWISICLNLCPDRRRLGIFELLSKFLVHLPNIVSKVFFVRSIFSRIRGQKR